MGNTADFVKIKMKVYLAVPLYGIGVDPDIYENHILMVMSSGALFGGVAMPKNRPYWTARNEAVEKVLADEYTKDEDFILWLDQDVIVAPGVLSRLISHNKDIVSGLYFMKEPPFYPLIMKKKQSQINDRGKYSNLIDFPNGLILLDDGAIGFGCVLTRVSIFKKIPKPWFSWTNDSGEDIDFCIKAKEQRIEIYYDSEIKCGHQGERKVFTYDDFKPFKGGFFKIKGA